MVLAAPAAFVSAQSRRKVGVPDEKDPHNRAIAWLWGRHRQENP
jgi:hypothetical protein